ncbi:MAG: MBL fold metallo-hydrolase [Deltaproteobacteria bacterium CG12_big_fil_rev_8_21_14_0_65_43_10]|nr:MAG: MBL fold metallo-hydrolase [Deltaproteobacteria bacterium CG2_30_43_15]PIQ46018.1 MAG: MBL fold metallo-hydrolase [Deltaproteobacteria bacterium CG12_big_fil_rev_8_21_14_0_65_43_10]PIU84585.1 MAG: MBL fold metallo-hydrolase [Deltaproteobacteria bacterium CG06_land_8_20_14_3_00_44_19]PIX25733.1 MAG: MBL fold metallo-hydrolase [Deltaproteobacteria bacterium CG_4_8_14_3_um_filter_43_13]PIZ18512.1 MAG: MBL fold metallo-hydrolase [Deltaproteobacteria bacterium CG_4_10_14_0_8_um_filter_43_12]
MKPIEIAKGIYWVGAIDWNIRDFHGYSTYQGTTYNSYLIMDKKITLIDTVKKEFADELLENISRIVDPKKIDCVISNHTEMDHSGGLPRVMHKIGEDKPLFCSGMGHKNLSRHFQEKWNYMPVEDGGEMNLGKRNLVFLETRMLHWPDSMFTYVREDKLLFSSDAFGQHYAGPERFDDQMGEAIMPHALKYFANILLPYSPLILKLVDRVTEMGLPFNTVCPDHGIIWRKDPGKIIKAYVEWSNQKPKKKAVVIYDTMWQSTKKMAEAIVAALGEEGVDARPMNLRSCHRSDIITEVIDAGAVIVGSPTLNNGIFPTVSDFLTYMKGLRPKNKIGAAFCSYGWSGEAMNLINKELEAMKFEIIDPGLKIQYVPDKEGIQACHELGKKIAQRLSGM